MYAVVKSVALVLLLVGASCGRTINSEGLAMIKHFEGYRANFYNDAVGIKTIGYGHACHSSDCTHLHPPLSEQQASDLLSSDLHEFERCVDSFASFLNDDQFSALVSFTYNLGCGSLTHSTLGKYVKAHDIKSAAGEFTKWVHAGGRVLKGLVTRRNAERTLFCKSGGC